MLIEYKVFFIQIIIEKIIEITFGCILVFMMAYW